MLVPVLSTVLVLVMAVVVAAVYPRNEPVLHTGISSYHECLVVAEVAPDQKEVLVVDF